LSGGSGKAPAYRVTKRGFDWAQHSERLRSFNAKYMYRIRLHGSKKSNSIFLDHLFGLPFIERQTRFIQEQDPQFSQIAVFSYESLDAQTVNKMAQLFNVRVARFEQGK